MKDIKVKPLTNLHITANEIKIVKAMFSQKIFNREVSGGSAAHSYTLIKDEDGIDRYCFMHYADTAVTCDEDNRKAYRHYLTITRKPQPIINPHTFSDRRLVL